MFATFVFSMLAKATDAFFMQIREADLPNKGNEMSQKVVEKYGSDNVTVISAFIEAEVVLARDVQC